MADTKSDLRQFIGGLTRRSFLLLLAWLIPFGLLLAYLVGLALGTAAPDTAKAMTYVLPAALLAGGVVLPFLSMQVVIPSALARVAGERAEARLARLMKLPYKVAFWGAQIPCLACGVFFTGGICAAYGRDPGLIGWGALIGVTFGFMLSVVVAPRIEAWILPHAVEEQHAHPGVHPRESGLFWPRQNWYLPYVVTGTLASSMLLGGAVAFIINGRTRDAQIERLTQQGKTAAAQEVKAFGDALVAEQAGPLAAGNTLLLIIGAFTAWSLARRQARAAATVHRAITGLAAGKPERPEWVSTDEIGDVAIGMNAVMENLKEIPATLTSSATQLLDAGNSLSSSNEEQGRSLSQQAAALHEAQVTSQEIKQTSMVAAERAESVLKVAMRAEELGQMGETTLNQSLAGLSAIRAFVDGIRDKVARLSQSAQQISTITETVKDLADQSNMLALNAAIEAVRSGEHGKGFSVVAREIRVLSDQSIRATANIQSIIEDITRAVSDAVSMTEEGARQVESGFEQVKVSGDSLRELSGIVRENSSAVRQISAAVAQQNEGISQIFSAIKDLAKGMDDTMKRLTKAQDAARTLQDVTGRVQKVAKFYRAER